eukprot:PhF_6_TR37915/c0_g1_i1/m.56652
MNITYCEPTPAQIATSGNLPAFLAGVLGGMGTPDLCRVFDGHFCGAIMHFYCSNIKDSVIARRDDLSTCADTSYPALGVCAPPQCDQNMLGVYLSVKNSLNTTQGTITQLAWKTTCVSSKVFQQDCDFNTSYFNITTYCENEIPNASEDTGAVVMFILCAVLVLCCVIGTLLGSAQRIRSSHANADDESAVSLVDYTNEYDRRDTNNSIEDLAIRPHTALNLDVDDFDRISWRPPRGLRFMLWFDVIANTNSLLTHRPHHAQTNFMNAFRVFSILWVILGHTLYFVFVVPGKFQNTIDFVNYATSWRAILTHSAYYGVDTFFFLSGFFEAHLFIRREVHISQFPLMYLNRYLRITPNMIFVMMFTWKLVPHLASGPLWYSLVHGKGLTEDCGTIWWQNVLYVNAVISSPSTGKQYCMSWYWYLSDDMIFFMIAPWFLYFFQQRKWQWVAVISLIGVQCASITLATVNQVMNVPMNIDDYDEPQVRASPFIYGILTALLLQSDSFKIRLRYSTLMRSVFYVLCAIAMCTCIYMIWNVFSRDVGDAASGTLVKAENFVYMALWGNGLMLFTLNMYTSRGSILKTVLSHNVFDVLGKLTFGVYLVHPLMMVLNNASLSSLPSFSATWLMVNCVANLAWGYMVSYLLYIVVEKPAENAANALWKPRKQ